MIYASKWMLYVFGLVVCAAAEALISIRPRLESGDADNQFVALGLIIAIVMLPVVRFLVADQSRFVKVAAFVVCGIISACVFAASIEGNDKARSAMTKDAREVIQTVAANTQRLKELKEVRLPEFVGLKRTSKGTVDIAQAAYEQLRDAVKLECDNGLGNNCRKRQDEVQVKLAAWTDANNNADRTLELVAIESEVSELERKLGVADKDKRADRMAANIAQLLNLLQADTTEAKVGEWVPYGQAAFLFILACIVPMFFPIPQRSVVSKQSPTESKNPIETNELSPTQSPTPKSKSKGRRKEETKEPNSTTIPSVGDWFADRSTEVGIVATGAGEVQTDYRNWCRTRGVKPASPPDFKRVMTIELVVGRDEGKGKATYKMGLKRLGPVLVKTA